MKKTLSLILAVVMIAALAVVNFPVSAAAAEIGDVAEGYTPSKSATAVSTADEFAAMTADGNYYLANDIDLSTLAKPYYNGCFAGTLDGCGHTIKLNGYSAFKSAAGATLKNIKTEGTVDTPVTCTTALGDPDNGSALGGFVQIIQGGVFYNLLNGADIIYEGELTFMAGGIYGKNTEAEATLVNCKNTGDVKVLGEAAGIAGWATTANAGVAVTFAGCVNEGTIESTASYAGGIVSRGRSVNNVENCLNTGKVIAYKHQAAGIVAYHWTTNSTLTIKSCENTGEIVIGANDPARTAAGILGGIGSGGSNSVIIEKCYNSGKLAGQGEDTAVAFTLAGIFGKDSRSAGFLDVRYCVNAADFEGVNSTARGIIGYSAVNTIMEYNVQAGNIDCDATSYSLLTIKPGVTLESVGNYYLDIEDIAVSDIEDLEIDATATLADDFASGKIAFELNELLDETVFYQNLEEDAAPVPLANRDTVVDNGDGTFNNEPTVTEPTTPFESEEEEPDEGDDPVDSGDEPADSGDEPAQTTTKDNTTTPTEPAGTTQPADKAPEGGVNVGLIIGIVAGVLVIAAVVVVIVVKGKKKQ